MGQPFRQDLIFVELILSSSLSFFEDQQSGILCQLYLPAASLPYLFLKKSEKYLIDSPSVT